METQTIVHFVGGHCVEIGMPADDFINGSDGFHEPATIMVALDGGHRLWFNPIHIACIEEKPKRSRQLRAD